MTQVLNTLKRQIDGLYVKFDPKNKKHLDALYSLRYKGRQLSDIRFFCEEPYHDVITMMLCKVTEQYLKEHGYTDFSLS